MGTGRRKTAVARVYIRQGSGKILINDKEAEKYFATQEQLQMAVRPLMITASDSKYDVIVNVQGGGLNGQAGACSHGIARALAQVDVENRASLKANHLLSRDSRMVERKKYGQRGARRRFQFSKR
ncbi:MAG: 30S ribosomal protein S9 [Spirochaetes bacterium]|uniref:Small ribosomal subunit protein uS9 n=1 Tax=Candidatus Avitreponema avistercoris TaxID=2840705 RepID=A0A9D9HGX1_9SPIR|nr:30S ribosomal protein S9 [Candidatus Avitreponema avistercoris]